MGAPDYPGEMPTRPRAWMSSTILMVGQWTRVPSMHVCRVPPYTLTCRALSRSDPCPVTQQLPWVTQSGPVQPPNVAEDPWGQNGPGSALGFKAHCSGHPHQHCSWEDGPLGPLPRCRHFYTLAILVSGAVDGLFLPFPGDCLSSPKDRVLIA